MFAQQKNALLLTLSIASL